MLHACPSIVEKLAAALALHQAGRLREAETGYRRILDAEPEQPLALHLLGVLALATGRPSEALTLLRRAATTRPGNVDTHLALADACAATGQRIAAIERYRALLVDHPGHLGALVNLANVLRDNGEHAHAIELVRHALAIAPGLVQAQVTLGSVLLAAGEVDAAVAAYRNAVSRAPQFAPARIGLAAALLRAEDLQAALAAVQQAIELVPEMAEAWFVRGATLRALHRFEPAVAALQRAVELDPRHARAQLALGNAHADLDRLACSEHHLRAAIALDPTLPEAHASLGFLLAGTGRLTAAVAACDLAIGLRPNFATAHWNRSFAHLLAGDFAPGWRDYEWRKRHDKFAKDFLSLPGREWQGEPLDGQTLLVHAEQGLGDTVQFARYLPLLAGRGARVLLACAPALIPVLRRIAGVAQVVPKSETLPPYDFWVDQMSLPRLFGTRPETIPSPGGYLPIAPRPRTDQRRPRVGLVWAGNPAHSNDLRRSMPVAALAPILTVPGIDWISLQVGPAGAEIAARYGIADRSAGLTDFAATAALIETLDLVIAVDTSTAHLAGAMGWPAWVMIPFAPDWRWMIGRSDSPWYASLQLFRQSAPGDWNGVAQRVAAALTDRFPATTSMNTATSDLVTA